MQLQDTTGKWALQHPVLDYLQKGLGRVLSVMPCLLNRQREAGPSTMPGASYIWVVRPCSSSTKLKTYTCSNWVLIVRYILPVWEPLWHLYSTGNYYESNSLHMNRAQKLTYKSWICIRCSHPLLLEHHRARMAISEIIGLIIVQEWPLPTPSRLK